MTLEYTKTHLEKNDFIELIGHFLASFSVNVLSWENAYVAVIRCLTVFYSGTMNTIHSGNLRRNLAIDWLHSRAHCMYVLVFAYLC